MQPIAVTPSLGRHLMAVAVTVASALCPLFAQAGAAVVSASAAASGTDVRSWLQRIHNAASQRNYQGTLVVTANGSVSSSRLAHYFEGKQYFERIDRLDGQPQRVYRHNDQVLTVWPAAKVARIEQRDAVAMFPAVLSGSEAQLFERYEMLAEGTDRVAGLNASVFLLRPRDGHRFAQRLWADQGSGLLLRADVLSPDGKVLETAAFTEVAIGVKAQPESVLAPMKKLDGYRVLRSAPQRTSLEAEGWWLKSPLAGFRQVSCVKRSLEAAGNSDGARSADVLQTIFSDGLTHVSVFIEPFRAERQRIGAAAFGATHTLMQPLGAHWITVVGDVPMATLKQFAAALERPR
ncbi:MAG: MucB/RseB C-terminal domain-containing protein [Burkholderiaceae bacterium]|nr:MucB/RseB C-terminal domain-containing protein [Burkholderiaceae bacterium]